MLRSGEDAANALLRHFDVDEDVLFAALQRQNVHARLEPRGAERPALRELPTLTMHAAECMEHAAELQREAGLASLDIGCLLGALLVTPGATAAAALAEVLPDQSIEKIGDATRDWLRGNDLTYPQTLQERFPLREPRRPATKGSAPPEPPDRNAAWPFLAVMRRHAPPDSPARFRATGLGLRRTRRHARHDGALGGGRRRAGAPARRRQRARVPDARRGHRPRVARR